MVRTIIVLTLLAILPSISRAQWATDSTTNTPVCVATGIQSSPTACSDAFNGAIIAWQDSRNGSSAIYAQRLDSNGRALWTKNGLRLAKSPSYFQTAPAIAQDGKGGAYIAWLDTRYGATIYAQHVMPDGTLGYPDTGLVIGSGANGRGNPVICDDGMGGAFAAWEDSRALKLNHRPDIYMNHLWTGGVKFVYPNGKVTTFGTLIDTSISTQRFPAICNDGSGGCFIAWVSGLTTPLSVRAAHADSSGSPLWGLTGFKVFEKECGDCANANPSRIALNRDGQQLMLAWEITSSNSVDTQNIMATRIRNANPNDSTLIWGQSIDVTGEMLYNQTSPQIFSDDEAVAQGADYRGILVPFENQKPGAADDWDVSMIRVLGTGATTLPGNYSAYDFATQPHGQTGFRAVKIDTSILAVWNDSRFFGGTGPDTCIYAQIIDKGGNKHFPTYRTTSKWGKAICRGSWTAKQVTVAPRTNGAIIAWTDYRASITDPSIYAQVLMKDGSLTNGNFTSDLLPPALTLVSRTGAFDSVCNARSTNMIATDSGVNQSGIHAIVPATMDNMKLNLPNFANGAFSVPFSVSVIDSLRNGSGTVTIRDTAANVATMDFTYCTIADTMVPFITWDTVTNWLNLHIHDDRSWDRGLLSVTVTDSVNITFAPSFDLIKPGQGSYNALAAQLDPTKASQFRLVVRDTVGNVSKEYAFAKGMSGVVGVPEEQISVSVYPNPVSGNATVRLEGASSADVSVFDVLGNAVDHFHIERSYVWPTSALPAGTYILRSNVGGRIVSKRIMRE